MGVSELVRFELDRHDWAALRCGCGDSAEHVPLLFETILTAETAREMVGYTLDDHLELNGNLFECAAPAVSVILAALADDHSALAHGNLLIMLWRLVSGDAHHTEVALGAAGLGALCRYRAREGLWTILKIGLTGTAEDAETAADICESIDLDERRLEFYRARLQERQARKTKRRRSRPTLG